jgi:hypothetical protein
LLPRAPRPGDDLDVVLVVGEHRWERADVRRQMAGGVAVASKTDMRGLSRQRIAMPPQRTMLVPSSVPFWTRLTMHTIRAMSRMTSMGASPTRDRQNA